MKIKEVKNKKITYIACAIALSALLGVATTFEPATTQKISDDYVYSDIRLKNVGKEFTGSINEINQLKFYNFTYKRDADKKSRVGVMAQDLQQVFPDAVSENEEGYLYIRKDEMFFASLNAIKDLFNHLTGNTEKIKALEERNAMLETQVKELQNLYIDLAKQVDKKQTKKKLTITPEKPAVQEVTPIDETAPSMPQTDTENKNS